MSKVRILGIKNPRLSGRPGVGAEEKERGEPPESGSFGRGNPVLVDSKGPKMATMVFCGALGFKPP